MVTAEIIDGKVYQITQALDESVDKAKVLVFGEVREFGVKPIDECCEICDFWKRKYKSINDCQTRQKKDAESRGFRNVICPNQFKD